MNVLIWFCCILAYSVVVVVLNAAGVTLGWIPAALLAVLLIFLPAPALCRAWGHRRQRSTDLSSGASSPRPPLSILRSRCFLVSCFVVALILSFISGGLVWRKIDGQRVWDAACIVGHDEGYQEGLTAGYNDGYSDGKWLYYWEVRFFRNNACIVTSTSTEYHHYGCDHINGSSYWIYNVELSEAKGYTPCPDCWEGGLNDDSLLSLPPLG